VPANRDNRGNRPPLDRDRQTHPRGGNPILFTPVFFRVRDEIDVIENLFLRFFCLKQSIKLGWNAQNDIDRALSELQDVYAFAKPLLQQELKDRFGVEDDVEETWLRLYAPAKTSWWVHDFSAGTTSRTVSLLDAALHNFPSDEAFAKDSEFITRPNALGHFGVVKLKHKLSIEQFKSLCRELDIGARYQQHLNEFLLPDNPVANNVLRYKVTLSQKTALNIAAQMALMKKDIDQEAYDIVQGMLDDRSKMQWLGQPRSSRMFPMTRSIRSSDTHRSSTSWRN